MAGAVEMVNPEVSRGRTWEHMERVGDDFAGFSVEFDRADRVMHVRAWGFWSQEVATSFDNVVGKACLRQSPWMELLVDMDELRPMRDEGQKSVGQFFARMKSLGVSGATVRASSPLTRLQVIRIVNERGLKDMIRVA